MVFSHLDSNTLLFSFRITSPDRSRMPYTTNNKKDAIQNRGFPSRKTKIRMGCMKMNIISYLKKSSYFFLKSQNGSLSKKKQMFPFSAPANQSWLFL